MVRRAADLTDAHPVDVPSPIGFPVEGQGQRDLMVELRWYLEVFLDYPFEPSTTRAVRVEAARERWGRAAFDALFHGGLGRDFLSEAEREGERDGLVIEIRSDNPSVLAWPWEALQNAKQSPIALACQVERRLTMPTQAPVLSSALPRDRLRILLVIARPFAADVGFRSVARPVVDLIESGEFPAEVTVLRPPTFGRLQQVLQQNPDAFHVLHFDGHGGYGSVPSEANSHQLKGVEGRLVFEDDHGQPVPVDASKLATLLARYKLPAVVLNACQSAMVDARADDPFASVAAALLRGGVRSVVAMAYSLYVTAAQVFLPAFYGRLFETGDIGRATQAGRRRMFDDDKRVCARGRYPLGDWMIPVLYQQGTLDFGFVRSAGARSEVQRISLPPEAMDSQNPYDFVGRDSALLALERALLGKPAGVVIHGLGGVGKTTLVRGFVNWLAQTNGLGAGVLWVDFRDVHSAEFVVNAMLGPLAGTNALSLPFVDKLVGLTKLLREIEMLVVWDNFESVGGSMPTEDRQILPALLASLRGGKSKVLLTSRSDERWLGGPQVCTRVPLGGLDGEERWVFYQLIVDDLRLMVNREDADQVALMQKLGGHPLLMRAVLPKLESMTAGAIVKAVETNLAAVVDAEDELGAKVMATLGFVAQSLPQEWVGLLVPLSLHEHFVVAEDLEVMAKDVPGDWSRARIDALLDALTVAGLVTRRGPAVFELHPALTTYLRERVSGDAHEEAWQRGFVDRMGRVADHIGSREPHEQQPIFEVRGANVRRALVLATTMGMHLHVAALTQSLGEWARVTRDFAGARALYEALGLRAAQEGTPKHEATAYHQLGIVAQAQRDFEAAERWYLKSLTISEQRGDDHMVAPSYHQLGSMSQEQREFAAAERWYLKSLTISEGRGDKHGTAGTYHQLGVVTQAQRDFDAAERWYLKSLALSEKLGNEHTAASYHNLGIVAQERRDFDAAERSYRKSLAISEKLGNGHAAASTYHQLGAVAREQRAFDSAEQWYRKSLTIREKLGDGHAAASTYSALGTLAQEQGAFDAAVRWYRKSLTIFENQGDGYRAANTYALQGTLAEKLGNFESAASLFIRAAERFSKTHAPHEFGLASRAIARCFDNAPDEVKPSIRQAWEAAGFPWPPE